MASRQDAPPAGGGESGQTDDEDIGPPADLSHAGAVVDKAIEYMVGQMIGPMAIASALLGGALGVLSGRLLRRRGHPQGARQRQGFRARRRVARHRRRPGLKGGAAR